MADTLSQYLRQRGIILDPMVIERDYDPVLNDDNLLNEAADMWAAHETMLRAVLQARVNAIGRQLLNHAVPEETVVLRQALVEVGAIANDFMKYKEERERRKTESENTNEPVTAAPPAPSNEGTL